MKYLVDAYVADPASGGNVLRTIPVEADDVSFKDGTAVFMAGEVGNISSIVFVRAFAPGIWTQVRPEPETGKKT